MPKVTVDGLEIEGHRTHTTDDAAAWPILGLTKHSRPQMDRRIAEKRGNSMLEAA